MIFKEFYILKEDTIRASDMDNPEYVSTLTSEQIAKMKHGKLLADKFKLKFNGLWQGFYTFTEMENGNTFLAKDEEELKQKLKKFRPTESILREMPHVATDDFSFDFKMEKPYWAQRLVKQIHVVGKDKIDDLLAPFYELYGKMFKVKFNQLPEEDKNLLRRKLPGQFLQDMGVE